MTARKAIKEAITLFLYDKFSSDVLEKCLSFTEEIFVSESRILRDRSISLLLYFCNRDKDILSCVNTLIALDYGDNYFRESL